MESSANKKEKQENKSMPIDMNKARQRMQQLQNQRKDYSKLSYGLKQGDNVLRFVTPPGEAWPFIYGSLYYKITKQFFISPEMYGQEDPILANLNTLKNSGIQQDAVYAKKYLPSRRVFALVLVRGQQDKGLVWVDFPQKVEKQLVTYILNQQYGDITDLKSGTDFTITKRKGASFPEYSVQPKRNASQLLPNLKEAEQLFNSIPNFKEAYKHHSLQQLQKIWQQFINGQSKQQATQSEQQQTMPDAEQTTDVKSKLQQFKRKKQAMGK